MTIAVRSDARIPAEADGPDAWVQALDRMTGAGLNTRATPACHLNNTFYYIDLPFMAI